MKKVTVLALAALLLFSGPVYAAETPNSSYFGLMKRDLVRGFTNIFTCVLEIPVTVKEYHQKKGIAGVRHVGGIFEGTLRTAERLASGAWDLVAAFTPSGQAGMPVEPEILF